MKPPSDPRVRSVAIIGAACRLPGGLNTPRSLWEALSRGTVHTAAPASSHRFAGARASGEGTSACEGILLDGVDLFDAGFFGVSPREAVQIDPQHRIFLECAVEALDAAGLRVEALSGRKVGVFLGIVSNDYAWLPEAGAQAPDLHSAVGGGGVFAANRLSHYFDLRGPSIAVDSTCSSSLVAAHLACRSLRDGESDVAVVGGVNLILSPAVSAATAQSVPIARDGRCKTFSAQADGTVRGEGCVVLVLKRLADAVRDGDDILATILGSAVNHDGRASALTAPNPQAQTDVITAACADAGVRSEMVAFLEAHGTGTVIGDAIEIEAAAEALGGAHRARACGLGSIKAHLGHLEAAAGCAGLLRAALSLQSGRITPHPLTGEPHPLIAAQHGTLELNLGDRRLGPDDVVGVSAFSLGGTNAHMVLGAAPPRRFRDPSDAARRPQIITVSGRSDEALKAQIALLGRALDAPPLDRASVADIAYTANARRSQHRIREAFVVEDRADLRRQLADAVARPARGTRTKPARLSRDRTLFVFSGHGSQWAGMARGLMAAEPDFVRSIEEMDALFSKHIGWSVAEFIAGPPDERRMASAAFGQPALLAVELALADLLEARGVRPHAAIGYSAGEIAAMVVTGMLERSEAARVVAARARALEEVGEGAMLAVKLAVDRVRRIAAEVSADLAIAAVCCAETTIVSGPRPDVEHLFERLERMNVLAMDAGVPYAFHHPAMRDKAKSLLATFDAEAWREPRLPLYASTLGRAITRSDICEGYWEAGACTTLRFDRAVAAALGDGYQIMIEVAPSAVLTGDLRELIRDTGAEAAAVATLRKGIEDCRALALAMANLYAIGAIDDVTPSAPTARQVALPGYAWRHTPFWWPMQQAAARESLPGEMPPAPTGEGKLYRLIWVPEAAPPPVIKHDEPRLPDFAALDDRTSGRRARAGLDAYAAREAEVDVIGAEFSRRALVALGAAERTLFSPDDLAVGERNRRLVLRLLEMSEEAGLIERSGEGWRLRRTAPMLDPSEALLRLEAELPGTRHELALLRRCGPHIADVIRGAVDPLALIFPGGDAGAAAAIFSDSGISTVMNALVADVVGALTARLPTAPLRVLEIGAGTGGTTKALRPLLDRPSISYCCTDISRSLLRQTARAFEGWRDFETRLLDIARDPADQGFALTSFDLIICANVLHAAPNIGTALAHVRSLLAPGGRVVLLEATHRQRIVDLTFGLTRDWWNWTDADVRYDHPLLPRTAWLEQLSRSGFTSAVASPSDPDLAARLGSSVFVAAAGCSDPPSALGRVLIVGGRNACSEALRQSVEQEGGYADIRADLSGISGAWTAVVDLRCLDIRSDEIGGGDVVLREASALFSGLFGAARWLASGDGPKAKLLIVTSGAVAVGSGDPQPDPLQAAFRSSVETLADERPDWPIAAIDVTPLAPAALTRAIWGELRRSDAPAFRAWRGSRRWTTSIVRLASPASGAPELDPGKLHIVTGGRGAIGLEVAAWMVERGARRVVLAQRRAQEVDASLRLAALRAAGAEIDLVAVDLSKPADAAGFAADLLARGRPVGGVVYAAGIFDDALTLNQDWVRFAQAFATKAVGAWELHRAFAAHPLDYVVYCSSVAGLLASAGLSNYVAANAFLEGLAERARRQGVPATCIAWGGWSGVGMASRLSERWLKRWRERGVEGLDCEDLRCALDGAVAGATPANLLVADISWDRCARQLSPRARRMVADLVDRPAAAPKDDRPRAAPLNLADIVDPLERRERIRVEVRRLCLTALELPSHFHLEPGTPLADLGLDSLLALELREKLNSAFEVDLPETILFDCPSAEAITARLIAVSAAPQA